MSDKLQELINRKPKRWGNLTKKEFCKDIIFLQSAVEDQQQEIERLEKFIDNLQVVHFTELQTEKAENQRCKQVLEFYADAINYITIDAKTNLTLIQKDGGEKARQELEESK